MVDGGGGDRDGDGVVVILVCFIGDGSKWWSLFFCKQMEVVVEDDGAEILGVKDWREEEMNE